jgi:chemotaxis protein histidine kinase CheA
MNLIAELVQEVGGRVGLGTAEGQYTRFTLTLPDRSRPGAATEAA